MSALYKILCLFLLLGVCKGKVTFSCNIRCDFWRINLVWPAHRPSQLSNHWATATRAGKVIYLFHFRLGHPFIQGVNRHETVCAGETVSFEVEFKSPVDKDDWVIDWLDPHKELLLDDSEHYFLNEDKTVLTLYDALPLHAGEYVAMLRHVFDVYDIIDGEYFQLDVTGIWLVNSRTSVWNFLLV